MRRTAVGRPRVALALRRQPRVRTGLVVVLAVLCGAGVAATVHGADTARAAWGQATEVVVARRDLAAGDRLDSNSTRLLEHPGPLIPPGALTELPVDARLAEPVYAGEVLRAERLAPAGLSAVAARLPADTRAVAVPVDAGVTPPLAVGDRVDVLVALGAEAAPGRPPGFALATDVVVVDVTEVAVTIAMPRDAAPRLAVAFGQGAVTLALVGR
ncbi:MAG TPA: SAF domain-containing protein [Acidimicrobiales bacterium]|nr:SAF domain-containing protein [Acidimicrobiales bacterium]